MFRGSIFSPFAQKYLLRKPYLPDRTGGVLRLFIDFDLNYHWDVKENNLYSEISRDFCELASADFQLYSTETECIVKNQPSWSLDECMNADPEDGAERIEEADRSTPCRRWRMENLAYYSPAHANKPDRYGIHLTKRGIAKLAYQVPQLCPSEPLEIVQLAAVYKLYVHEMCHAWIEDICCLIDFFGGETGPRLARRYAKINQRFNGYIFMEEAICNTAAYGWLRNFLGDTLSGRDDAMPSFNSQNILNAFAQWMRGQPQGYRDFAAIKEPPHRSELFVQNICRLLVEIYEADRFGGLWDHPQPWHARQLDGMSKAVEVFFAGHLTPDCRYFRSRNADRSDAMWVGKPPSHVE
jgi:hypothetical protein